VCCRCTLSLCHAQYVYITIHHFVYSKVAGHLQLLLLSDHGVILTLQEARFPFQLSHDSCQLLIADLLAHNVLPVGVYLILDAALLLMLLCDCIL